MFEKFLNIFFPLKICNLKLKVIDSVVILAKYCLVQMFKTGIYRYRNSKKNQNFAFEKKIELKTVQCPSMSSKPHVREVWESRHVG